MTAEGTTWERLLSRAEAYEITVDEIRTALATHRARGTEERGDTDTSEGDEDGEVE